MYKRQGLFQGDDAGQLEEGCLENGVDTAAHADFAGDVDTVDDVKAAVLLCQVALDRGGQLVFNGLGGGGGVEQEGAALLEVARHVVLGEVGGVVAGHEVGLVDKVGRLDGLLAKTKVRHRDAARLLGVVGEIGLDVEVGAVADDFDEMCIRDRSCCSSPGGFPLWSGTQGAVKSVCRKSADAPRPGAGLQLSLIHI